MVYKIQHNIKKFDTVIFENYPDVEQKLWPAHCVQGSFGAELHPDLRVIDEKTDKMRRSVVYVKKGSKSDIDSYSAFFDNCRLNETTLNSDLKQHGITDLYVCGLAADVCVGKCSDLIFLFSIPIFSIPHFTIQQINPDQLFNTLLRVISIGNNLFLYFY